MAPRQCSCGSNLTPTDILDGHSIYLTHACDKCRTKKMREFRPDINTRYTADEPIEPED